MNQTENYGMNQWELTDRIRMEDFNGDNAKIDAALKSQAEALAAETAAREAADTALAEQVGLHTIKTVTQPGNDMAMMVDLSDIDWSQWKAVHIFMELQGTGYFHPNFSGASATSETFAVPGKKCLTLLNMHGGVECVSGILCGYNKPIILGPCITYQNLTYVVLRCSEDNYSIYQGSKVTIKGEK